MSLMIEGTDFYGVSNKKPYICQYCMNQEPELFHRYYDERYQKGVVYCRACIRMTCSSTETKYDWSDIPMYAEAITYSLDFELTEQQKHASESIVRAVRECEDLLLHAVTGAGKTEMILESIRLARANGLNVAIVSPRVDVVKELALRMENYFNTAIDVLYQGQSIKYESRFVISTVQQLVKYQSHFGLIIIDEVDAFPLPMDKRLQRTIKRAATQTASIIYLTATPPPELKRRMKDRTIVLPARYHRRQLPVPVYKFLSKKQLMKGKLKSYLQRTEGTYLLVFFNDIASMEEAANVYQDNHPLTVYAADCLRHEKVEAIRAGRHPIIFTTTILERGFTMASLDVFIIDAGSYTAECLIQMSGRVDRKFIPYDGQVIMFHEGVTYSMQQSVREIKTMNRLARRSGWLE
ncbi:DEAD/DEAH box helicase [Macrococcus hajekii]|uniref:DEAD/DEAH box helicase n=1 Tax=Macrococcus hajekii TaxID=198482 RepID=A0A4V3BDU0_9STAP|nr:DEAD/DEAH box helicase family protein [Macrococcus hajekii]TDM01474.1 DEAD/DEAH box helicase [Macrococcus hajekii]GGB00272.1 hypothetical protein GCM10007190_05430 [Macrococcus hajekii]